MNKKILLQSIPIIIVVAIGLIIININQDILKNSMSSAHKLLVPLEVDIGSGKNWDQAH